MRRIVTATAVGLVLALSGGIAINAAMAKGTDADRDRPDQDRQLPGWSMPMAAPMTFTA